jgi:hypothetical protein
LSGYELKEAMLYSSLLTFSMSTFKEAVMDDYFSWSDQIANLIGITSAEIILLSLPIQSNSPPRFVLVFSAPF